MSVNREKQLEIHIDHAQRNQELHLLKEFLQNGSSDICPQKCSKQFIAKLDKLICKELENKEQKNVSVLLTVIYKFGKCLTTNGDNWLTASIKQGLVKKMIAWFEKAKEIMTFGGRGKNDAAISFVEDFFDVVMIVHDHNNEGKIQILENFIVRLCSLISDTAFNTFIKQEVVRKLNLMLDSMPQDIRKKILFTQEMMCIMSAMGKRIIDAGDYDLQVAITEALCRMTSEKQRREFARQWFPMEFVTEAFKKIKDANFETDCRKFLNFVNGMLGDKRRVFTYPCRSVFLEKHELQIPTDENLEEFWIDFNVGTQSISFYVSTDDGEDHQWETVCVTEDGVETYNVEEIDNEKLLTVFLKNPTSVDQKHGKEIRIYFDSLLDISDVSRKVFGANKLKGFTRKETISVAKTAVHIIFDESGSQILIPESQESLYCGKRATVSDTEQIKIKNPPAENKSSTNQQIYQEENGSIRSELVTPNKRKVSEASMVIPSISALSMKTPATTIKTPKSWQGRVKPPLEIINSAERSTVPISISSKNVNVPCLKNKTPQFLKIHPTSVVDRMQADEIENLQKRDSDEQEEIVEDTQQVGKKNCPMLPGITESYLNNNKYDINKKQNNSGCLKDRISISSNHSCKQDTIISDRVLKQQAFISIFEGEQSPRQTRKNNHSDNQQPAKVYKNRREDDTKDSAKCNEKSVQKKKNKNVDKAASSKSNAVCKSNDYKEINKISINPDQMDATSYNIKQGIKKTPGRRRSERSLNAGSPPATVKDTETEMNGKAKELQEAAKSLICRIGKKYSRDSKPEEFSSTRENTTTYVLHKNKEKSHNRTFNLKKTKDFSKSPGEHWNDVYNFNFSGTDNPTIKLGVTANCNSKQTGNVSMRNMEESSEIKCKSKKDNERKPKSYNHHKHLFSDTDTEKGADDSKTDVSWLHNSKSKEKPKLLSYCRQKPAKKKDQTLQHQQAENVKNIENEKAKLCKESRKIDALKEHCKSPVKHRMHRPSRKAAMESKNYKDLSDSEHDSEEKPQMSSSSRKKTCKKQPLQQELPKMKKTSPAGEKRKKAEKCKTENIQKKKPKTNVKTSCKKNENDTCTKLILSPVCLFKSPPSIEQTRCEEYAFDTEVLTTHKTFGRSFSPSLPESSPLKLTPKNSNGISTATFYSTSLKKVNNQWTESPKKALSRVGKNKSMSSPSGKETCSPISSPVTQENTPVSIPSFGSGRRKISCKSPQSDLHKSGPTVHTSVLNLKRMYKGNFGESADQTGKRIKSKLVPKRLFADESYITSRVSESVSTVSGIEVSNIEADTWETNCSDVDVMCHKISKEFTRKIENRSRKMDYFTKHSLKSAQQHLTSMTVQVREHSTKCLDKFQVTLLEEIETFEKDSQVLKTVEKEFTNIWKQQTQAFNSYQKNEKQRMDHLKSSFEKNVLHCFAHEEHIFNSEINLMRCDMKLVQDRLLKEMQEEELLNVRRGLQSLFMS